MYKPLFLKREVLVFRHFQRKGYSLFACLGREVVISVLSAATLSATKAAGISDEVWRVDSTGHVREVQLSDVGVTGSRVPLAMGQAARMVTVLSREDIAQAPVQSVNDLLKYAVGVDVRQRGALGSQTDISIRGGTQEQITILLNGIVISDPQTGHNAMDLPCQLSEIVRIEVLEGPAGRVYGTSSLVGAINIVTLSTPGSIPSEESIEGGASTTGGKLAGSFETGSFGYAKVALVASLPSLSGGGSLSASYARSDGYSRSRTGQLNTGYSGAKAYYKGAYCTDGLHLNWHFGLSDRGWGSGTFYATPRWNADEQYEHTRKLFADVQADVQQGALHLLPAIYWQQHNDRYEGYHNRPDLMPYNYNKCNVYGVKVNAYFDTPLGRTALGAELRHEDLISSNLGEPLSRTHHICGTDRDYTLGINRTNISAHLEHNIVLRRLTVSAGFVATKNSWSTMNMTVYPGIDMSYHLVNKPLKGIQMKVFAGWNTSLRLPSFTEMYYRLQGYAADPHLKPEEMQAIEIGAQMTTPWIQTKASVFHHSGRNMIDWLMDTSQGINAVWKSINHTRINTTGIETAITLRLPTPHLRTSSSPHLPTSSSHHLHVSSSPHLPPSSSPQLHISYGYMNQDKSLEQGFVSQYALEYLRHKFVVAMQMPLCHRLSGGVGMRWQDRVGSYTNFEGEVINYKPYALMDARLDWTGNRFKIYAEINNLLNNKSYVDYGNVAQPGAWFIVGTTIF